MNIPPKFDKILKNNQAFDAMVKDIITDFEPILKDNKLFFFEEYTEHGIEHIEMVLKTAEFLIPDESFEYIKPEEIAIFILAVVFHDIGMHTYFSTFKAMLDGKYNDVRVDVFDNGKTWQKLWDDYLLEARHWNSKQLNDIFGNPNEIAKEPDLSDKDKLTEADKKLIGEFIRRNHARLAHEIALKGFIGDNTIYFKSSKFDERYKELIGIVARSHGIKIRETFCYLKKIAQDAWQYPDGLNVVFLMVLLRISDYLHIDKTRTNHLLLKVKALNSPVSIREHKMHLSIRHIHFGDLKEPELIYVECDKPVDARMYVKIQTLIKDLQHELDLSWAILGEIYGFNPEKRPKFKFRRIDSNLEALELDYVPQNIAFKINNELSKLLVAPLYGDDPKYGIRELVQNATDACKERMKIEKDKGNTNYDPLVTVSINKINEEHYLFKIQDNGKGMTLDEILNYYLSIGSSFRQSYEWKREFTSRDGNVSINRNGKFGIGVLATFLLGDEITIKTKSYKKGTYAYIFKATLNSENIDVKKLDNFDIGTTIEILMPYDSFVLLKEKKHGGISWTSWYINEKPSIKYYFNKRKVYIDKSIDSYITRSFLVKNFGKIQWGYKTFDIKDWGKKDDAFASNMFVICNDIIITSSSSKSNFKYTDENQYIIDTKPSLKIEDPNGILKLKLDRSDLDTDILPFEEELLLDVSKDFIAKLINLPFDKKTIDKHQIYPHNTDFLFLKNGFVLISDYFLKNISDNLILLRIVTGNDIFQNPSFIFEISDNFIIYSKPHSSQLKKGTIIQEAEVGSILLSKKEFYEMYRNIMLPYEIEWETEDYITCNIRNYKRKSNIFDKEIGISIMNKLGENLQAIQEVPFDILIKRKGGEILNELFEKYFGDNCIIPYDIEERKKLYPLVFNELKDYMKNYEK